MTSSKNEGNSLKNDVINKLVTSSKNLVRLNIAYMLIYSCKHFKSI